MGEAEPKSFNSGEHLVVPWLIQDRMLVEFAARSGELSAEEVALMPEKTVKTISRGAIAEFCGSCDYYREDEPCPIVGVDGQIRYAARQGCGWAKANGTRGQMAEEGFRS